MKKTFFAISALLFSINCLADEPNNAAQVATESNAPAPIEVGKQYFALPTYPSPNKEVIEFFSFNSPSSFRFETQYHFSQVLSKAMPEGVTFKRYHIIDYGSLGLDLSQAWAVANVLNMQDEVSEALYTAVQKDRKIKSLEDIKAVFETLGVNGETYDKTVDSFLAKAFMAQQVDAINEMQPDSVPLVIVNRKYFINGPALDRTSGENFANDYARVAVYLSNLDNKSKPKTEPVSNPQSETAPVLEAKSETVAPATTTQSETAPVPEVKPEPVAPATTTQSETAPVPEAKPETVAPATTTQPETAPVLEAKSETVAPATTTQPETTPIPEVKPEPVAPATTTQPETTPALEAKPETVAPATTTQPETAPVPEAKPETVAPATTTQSETAPVPEAKPETVAPATTAQPETAPAPEAKPETVAPATTTQPETAPVPEAKPETVVPATTAQPETAPVPEAKPETVAPATTTQPETAPVP
ncbi:DsbA family protein, partial [Gilliamella sp. wkB108]|uniref:DsbA family protein n=1 Tax=Gilliamella sp. wkB108 TaxID=3120256 RepID=UPI000AE2111C